MRIYLDLNKAGGTSTGGTTTKKEGQSIASNAESYAESPSGVANADASYDDPKVGKKWKHSEDDGEELEAARQKRNKQAQDRNLVPTPEEAGTVKKAFDESANDMVKSLTSGLRSSLGLHQLTNTEVEFLQVIKGYSSEEIQKGGQLIAGKDRKLFSDWLCERVAKSLDGIYRR